MKRGLPTFQQPEAVTALLRSFAAGDRSRGETYYRNGHVHTLTCVTPGTHYQATVTGSEIYTVDLELNRNFWLDSCSCPIGGGCKHTYAALKTLVATVDSGPTPVVASETAKALEPPRFVGPLADQLRSVVGHTLTAEENEFLRKVHEVASRVAIYNTIQGSDFLKMGLHAPCALYEQAKIWPALPRDEHEFWLYVAHAVKQAGGEIPKFMEPVTDLTEVSGRMRRWLRGKVVQEWRTRLEGVATEAVASAPVPVDLRVRLTAVGAVLEWLRPGATEFAELKHTHFTRLADDVNACRVALTPEAEILWQTFRGRYGSTGDPWIISVNHFDSVRATSFLLRTAQLREHVVGATGVPFTWSAEPLRWDLTPAANAEDDYLLRLVLPDGAPAPRLFCVVPGAPALYVGEATIFPGPPKLDVLDPRAEHHIPAAALEQREGVELLRKLGTELPERLRDRVQTRPLRVRIRASLRRIDDYSNLEDCVVEVEAFSEDGAVLEQWTPAGWASKRTEPAKRKASGPRSEIIFHDRAALAAVPPLMAPLECKFDRWQGRLTKRLNKKFPELFATWLATVPPEIEVKLEGELASLTEGAIAGTVQLEATEAGVDWFDLRVVLNVADTKLTQAEIKLLLSAKGGFVRLEKKGWRKLAFQLTAEEDEQLARLGLTSRELTDEPQRLHALQLADPAAKRFLPEPQTQAIQRRATEIKTRVSPELPVGLRADLRPYQLEGFHFLAYLAENNFGGILADDMGLGKTLQTLAWLLWLRAQPRPPQTPDSIPHSLPSLVVCPKSVTDNWRAEVERFAPGLRVRIWHGPDAANLPSLTGTADLHVLNYTQLRLVGESLARTDFQAVILDEGQYIKNPSSQTAQIARALRSEHRLVLSGTPIENRLLDLWSLMSFAMPGVLGSRAEFGKLYDAKEDPNARRRLSARVRAFLLRRTKSQVARDLPDRVEEDLFCEIESEQKTLYRAELKRAQQMLLKVATQKQLNKDRFHFLTSLLRLRQICCHPKLVKADSKAASAKVEALLDQLEPLMEEGHKVLVFSQFVTLLDLLKDALAEKGWPLHYLAGHTENRGDVVREFQSQEGAGVFLISLKAGGFGLNLTAASYVVLFDPWWNPAVEAQAIDRTHRIGQTQKVIAYRLLIKDSIEEKIRALQKTKSALAEDVLGEEKFAQALTLDDLRFLFAD